MKSKEYNLFAVILIVFLLGLAYLQHVHDVEGRLKQSEEDRVFLRSRIQSKDVLEAMMRRRYQSKGE